jgi:hypothetical protein
VPKKKCSALLTNGRLMGALLTNGRLMGVTVIQVTPDWLTP